MSDHSLYFVRHISPQLTSISNQKSQWHLTPPPLNYDPPLPYNYLNVFPCVVFTYPLSLFFPVPDLIHPFVGFFLLPILVFFSGPVGLFIFRRLQSYPTIHDSPPPSPHMHSQSCGRCELVCHRASTSLLLEGQAILVARCPSVTRLFISQTPPPPTR